MDRNGIDRNAYDREFGVLTMNNNKQKMTSQASVMELNYTKENAGRVIGMTRP